MKINKLAVSIVAITLLFTGGVVWLAVSMSSVAEVQTSANAKAIVSSYMHDWGDIKMDEGKVRANFEVKNEGTEDLKLYNVASSCTCTMAKIIMGDITSPIFGMHTKSDFVMVIPPGQTAQVQAEFNPAFHGPTGVGTITRNVTVETNDASQPQLSFTTTANVSR